MKTKLLLFLFLIQFQFSKGQNIQIDAITPTAVSGGINVNVLVTTFNGAGYLSHTYSVSGSTINLSVCYWFNITLPVFQISTDFLIPVSNTTNYTINVSTTHSASATVCDNFSSGPSGTANYLSTDEYEILKENFKLIPNPSNGFVDYLGSDIEVEQLTLFDHLGRLIEKRNQVTETEFDFSHLSEGIYIIQIDTEKGVFNQKLIIKK
jgi:Secretion system C-terminal sorting domain